MCINRLTLAAKAKALLYQSNFNIQNDKVVRRIMWRMHAGSSTTQSILESCFAHLRDLAQRQSKSTKYAPSTAWFYSASSPYVSESGMGQVLPSTTDWAQLFQKRKQHPNCEEVRAYQRAFRLDSSQLPTADHIAFPKSAQGFIKTSWRNAGPLSHYKSSAAMGLLLQDCEENFGNVNKAWCGVVLTRNGLFYHTTTEMYFLSLGFHSWSALGITLSVMKDRGQERDKTTSKSPFH